MSTCHVPFLRNLLLAVPHSRRGPLETEEVPGPGNSREAEGMPVVAKEGLGTPQWELWSEGPRGMVPGEPQLRRTERPESTQHRVERHLRAAGGYKNKTNNGPRKKKKSHESIPFGSAANEKEETSS